MRQQLSPVLSSLLAELQFATGGGVPRAGQRHTGNYPIAAGNPQAPNYMGPGGLFGYPGLSQDIISTRLTPMGLVSELPLSGTIEMNPIFPYLVGFDGPTGDQPEGPCDEPPTAGAARTCLQVHSWGRVPMQTREINIEELGTQTNRGEFRDLRLVNDPLVEALNGIANPLVPGGMGNGLNMGSEVVMRFIEVAVDYQNAMIPLLWDGNPSNNTAKKGYMESPGLNQQIAVGHIDAVTKQACPTLDSLIIPMSYGKVDTIADTLIKEMASALRSREHLARRTHLGTIDWAWVMKEDLFYELTAVWPCSYLTQRCGFVDAEGNARLNVDARDAVDFRDSMRQGSYLLMDGRQVRVIFDDGIHEDDGDHGSVDPGCFASDMYLLPMHYLNGTQPGIYLEHLDYSRTAMAAVEDGPMLNNWFWSDGGVFLWNIKVPRGLCVQWETRMRYRIVLKIPHMAVRFTNIQYCPIRHTQDALPTGASYVEPGGVSGRQGASFYQIWDPNALL